MQWPPAARRRASGVESGRRATNPPFLEGRNVPDVKACGSSVGVTSNGTKNSAHCLSACGSRRKKERRFRAWAAVDLRLSAGVFQAALQRRLYPGGFGRRQIHRCALRHHAFAIRRVRTPAHDAGSGWINTSFGLLWSTISPPSGWCAASNAAGFAAMPPAARWLNAVDGYASAGLAYRF